MRGLPTARASRIVLLLVATSLATGGAVLACGDDASDIPSSGGTGDDGGAGAGDGGVDAATSEPYTLDDVCDRLAPVLCDLRRSCCTAGPGYDEAGCLAHAKADCAKDVDEARAGKSTFHPERIEGCLPKYRAIFSSCTLTVDLLQKFVRDISGCQAFDGQLATGDACERGSQCRPSTTKDTVTGCDDDTKKCKDTTLVAENGGCGFSEGLPLLCDDGLYCDADFSKEPVVGTCKKKTALQEPCDKTKEYQLQCGLGNYCDPATARCTPGKGGNASCAGDLDCASIKCTKPDAGPEAGSAANTCVPPKLLAKAEECKGP